MILLTNIYIRLIALASFCGFHVSDFCFVEPFIFHVNSTSHGVFILRVCLFNVHCPLHVSGSSNSNSNSSRGSSRIHPDSFHTHVKHQPQVQEHLAVIQVHLRLYITVVTCTLLDAQALCDFGFTGCFFSL